MLLAALTGLRAIPLHDISEELQTADAIPDGVASDIETARQITVGTDWPAGLDDLAAELETNLDSFMQALDDEDLEASKGTSIEVHQAWHELDSTGYPYYAAEDTAAGGDHEENGSGPGHEEDSTETPSS
jgi:hypothetical protein